MAEYRLTRAAEDDLLTLFLHGIDAFGIARAEEYKQGLDACFRLLAATPRLGRLADPAMQGVRRHEHRHHVIFYDEQPYGVLIIAVIHERSIRRWADPPG